MRFAKLNKPPPLKVLEKNKPPGGLNRGFTGRPEGGALPYKRLIGMCCWMGSHFHDWTDYNGVAFSKELLEWGRTFSDFWGRELLILMVSKRTIGQRIDYNGVGALRGQRHIPSKN